LACSHRWFTWPVPRGIPPVGSYPTLSPITCATWRATRPSAGLLSVALDVTEGLRPSVPRVLGPSGLCYESGLCSTLRAKALKRSDGSDGPDPLNYTLLAGRRAPCASAAEEHDPGRCNVQLYPLCADPALLPAWVVPDFGVEPDAWACWLEHAFVGGVVLRIVQRRAGSATVYGVARAERLHRRRARPESAGDPLVAPALVNPTADVVYKFPQRNSLIYSHARHRPLFNCSGY
jgi:hypothetical protein